MLKKPMLHKDTGSQGVRMFRATTVTFVFNLIIAHAFISAYTELFQSFVLIVYIPVNNFSVMSGLKQY